MKVAIIGHGFVGNATEHFITTRVPMVDEVVIEDPAKNLVVEDWSDVNYTFICSIFTKVFVIRIVVWMVLPLNS